MTDTILKEEYILHSDEYGWYCKQTDTGFTDKIGDATILTNFKNAHELCQMCGLSMHDLSTGRCIYFGRH